MNLFNKKLTKMKKNLLSIVSIVVMALAVLTMTSCSKNEKSVVMQVRTAVYYTSGVSPETQAGIELTREKMDVRLNKIFGETFNVPCDEDGDVSEATMKKFNKKIDNDKTMNNLLLELAEYKATDDRGAVYQVDFVFFSGSTTFWKYVIN